MTLLVRALVAAAALAFSTAQAQATAPSPLASEHILVGAEPYKVQVASGGDGRYTVIFESGFGTDLRTWRKVAPGLAGNARVFTYSRAGHGSSDARPEPRTIDQNTAELDQLIAAARLAPPYILVSHSYGGLLARSFAARHPGQVAGMVFVDPADEHFNPALRQLDATRAAEDDRQFAAIVPARFQPEFTLLQPVLDSGALPLAGTLPNVPTVLLTSVQQSEKPMFFLESAQAVAIKKDLHANFLRQFSDGSHVVTPNSGHHIQLDEPELVIAAVNKVIAAADRQMGKAGQ